MATVITSNFNCKAKVRDKWPNKNTTAADSPAVKTRISIQYICTVINLIGLLDYHYLQTANGAIVGKQKSIFTSQRFLLQANSLTLDPVFCFW